MKDKGRKSKARIAGVFSRAASTYDRVGPRFFSYFGRRLVKLAGMPMGIHVLDVASGRGAILFPAAEQAGPEGRVIGIDFSRAMLRETRAEIRSIGLDNVEVCQMDAEQLGFPDNSFHFVLCGFSVFLFPQFQQALSEFYRVLRPEGRVGITTFAKDESDEFEWINELFLSYLPSHVRKVRKRRRNDKVAFDMPEGVEEILKKAGFENVEVIKEEKEFVYANEKEWWDQLWSHGGRGTLERIVPDDQERLKCDIFRGFKEFKREDGIHMRQSVLFTFGTRSR